MTYGRAAWRRGRIPSKSAFWPRIGIRTGIVHSSTGLSVPSLFRWPISNIPASRGAEASVGVVWSRSRVVRCCAVFSFHMRCSAPSLCHRACIFCSLQSPMTIRGSNAKCWSALAQSAMFSYQIRTYQNQMLPQNVQ